MPAIYVISVTLALANVVYSTRLAFGHAQNGGPRSYPLLAQVPVTGTLTTFGASLLSAEHAATETGSPIALVGSWFAVLALPALHLGLLAAGEHLGRRLRWQPAPSSARQTLRIIDRRR